MQRQSIQPHPQLLLQHQRMSRELNSIKVELYNIYEENIRLREVIQQQEKDRLFMRDCEEELVRLKGLLREVTEKRDSMPSEREEIKDRIIMKLQDELISTKIELKEVTLQLNKLTRMQ